MVATLPAKPVYMWCVAGRVCDMVDSGCVDTQWQFLAKALPDDEQALGKGKSHTPVPPAPRRLSVHS